jgi:hypothetical protein
MKKERTITSDVIKKIKTVQARLDLRDAEKARMGDLFPMYEALKYSFNDEEKNRDTSKEIISSLKTKDLLGKECFLKRTLRKELRRTIREAIIRHFGIVDSLDDIEEKIMLNLEEEYG